MFWVLFFLLFTSSLTIFRLCDYYSMTYILPSCPLITFCKTFLQLFLFKKKENNFSIEIISLLSVSLFWYIHILTTFSSVVFSLNLSFPFGFFFRYSLFFFSFLFFSFGLTFSSSSFQLFPLYFDSSSISSAAFLSIAEFSSFSSLPSTPFSCHVRSLRTFSCFHDRSFPFTSSRFNWS